MKNHPSGDPDVNREHIKKQRKGDQELSEKPGMPPEREENGAGRPGTGRPDAEEGVGTVQNQRR
jgi:hypothetical protein